MKTFIITFLFLAVISNFPISEPEYDDITGVYISKAPTFGEKAAIMYSRGHMNFLYTAPDNKKLELKAGNTFILTTNTCNKGITSNTGTWKRSEKIVTLDFDDKDYEDQSFTLYKKNRLYWVGKITILESGEIMPDLTLLEKH